MSAAPTTRTDAVTLPTGVSVAFDDIGSGQPVLFLHGFPLDRTMWRPQLNALAPHARCIAPDLRGFGDSAARAGDEERRSIDDYAHDAAALLDALGLSAAHVAGFSMGGYVALAMWRLYPERIAGLALIDTRAGADTAEGRAKRDELIALARSSGSSAVAEKQLTGLLGRTSREGNPAVVAAARAMIERAPVPGIVAALEAMRERPDSTPVLGGISVPVAVVVGDEDVLTPLKEARVMADRIPGATLDVIAQSGHLSPLERPDAVNDILLGWRRR